MTTDERVRAIADYGFTERQARFLVLVMRHAGLCVKRQYAAFAGIKPGGEKCNAFFDKLVRRGYAVTADCIHNRARLYHVHHKPLYHAIGEPESRYRRAVPARRAAERLMRVDAALIDPDLDWLTTRSEKLAYMAARTAPEPSEPPVEAAVQDPPDLFPATFPIGIDGTGRAVLVYVVTVPWADDFRPFLVEHVGFFAVMPAWTLRIVFPPSLQRVVPDYERAVHEELENVHIASYTESVTIPVHPEFSRDPEERAVVIVREGYGVVGLKDAWTPEQLRRGKISHRIGHFTADEVRLLEADTTRSTLPPETT